MMCEVDPLRRYSMTANMRRVCASTSLSEAGLIVSERT